VKDGIDFLKLLFSYGIRKQFDGFEYLRAAFSEGELIVENAVKGFD
jgi:hypothetical protein